MHTKRGYIILMIVHLAVCSVAMAYDVKDSVKVYFRQGHSLLDLSFKENQSALGRIVDSLNNNYVDSIYILRKVKVVGSASPEGREQLNKQLSEKRADVLLDYLSTSFQLPDSIEISYFGQDYRGLLRLVEGNSNVPYQEEVIKLLREIIGKEEPNTPITNPQRRLATLRGGKPYDYMYRHLFPELRVSWLVMWFDRKWAPSAERLPETEIAEEEFQIEETMNETDSLQTVDSPISLPVVVERQPRVALKTNLLMDALLVPNIGAEVYLGNDISLSTNWHYAWWNTNSWYWRTYGGEVAVRKWFGKRVADTPLAGHHVGVYAQALTYDFLVFGNKGYMSGEPGQTLFDRANYAVGIEYGYSLPIAHRLHLDFVLGIGYQGGKYNEYLIQDDCYVWQARKNRGFVGPTKAEVSLVWLLDWCSRTVEKKGGAR